MDVWPERVVKENYPAAVVPMKVKVVSKPANMTKLPAVTGKEDMEPLLFEKKKVTMLNASNLVASGNLFVFAKCLPTTTMLQLFDVR